MLWENLLQKTMQKVFFWAYSDWTERTPNTDFKMTLHYVYKLNSLVLSDIFQFNDEGNLVVTIDGVSKTFEPKSENVPV